MIYKILTKYHTSDAYFRKLKWKFFFFVALKAFIFSHLFFFLIKGQTYNRKLVPTESLPPTSAAPLQ